MIKMLNAIDQFGWASQPGCLNEADSFRLRVECCEASDRGEFKRAGVGRGLDLQVREEIRSDHVMWLQTDAASVEQLIYLAKLELLRLALNQRFFLGLFEYEGHFAIYPVGAFYKAHLDRHTGTSDRIVTTILYLNPNWQPGDGGELKLWTTKEGRRIHSDRATHGHAGVFHGRGLLA
jgi:SM-20-related protein